MACTPGNSLTDSCTCLGMSEPCGSGKYCYDNQCKSENTCGAGACEAECFCAGNGKIATKCHGDNKYCKNGKVMSLCTAASLATDECACTVGDAGICMGFCDDGICYGKQACNIGDATQTHCICTAADKKVGLFKKGKSTVCTSEGVLEPIEGGCGNDVLASESCKCAAAEDICQGSTVCRGFDCVAKCAEGDCRCTCTGDYKVGINCYGGRNQCVNGKIVPLPGYLVCLADFDSLEYCQCSSESANLCGYNATCDGSDCYKSQDFPYCTRDSEAVLTCKCYYANPGSKIFNIAKPGDYCDANGNVSKKCADGVPSLIDSCFCGNKDGPQCKKGDVCIGNQCYGADLAAVGGYCEYDKPCTTACACADTAFATGELCFGQYSYCVDGAVVLRCPAGLGKENGDCKACDANCSECFEDRAVCTKCSSKSKLEAGKCMKSGLGIGAIIGIVVVVVVVLAAAGVGIFFFLKHKKQEKKPGYQEEKEQNEAQVAVE